MLNCLLITICWIIILDQLHFWEEFSSTIKSILTKGKFRNPIQIKPFSCSVCMSFWCNLIYIIIIGKFSIFMIGYILLLSWSAPLINSIFTLGKNLFLKLINTIANKLYL